MLHILDNVLGEDEPSFSDHMPCDDVVMDKFEGFVLSDVQELLEILKGKDSRDIFYHDFYLQNGIY